MGNETYREIKTKDSRLFYILGGEGSIIIEGIKYPLTAGACVLTRRIIQHIQKHYNEPFSSKELTRLFHFNAIYINRVFKKYTGTTVQRFLTDYRLRMSTELLKSSESSVGEIASLVGFDDLAYFSKLFKKMYGVSPTQYRN